MKKLLLIAAIGIGSLAAVPAKAQVSLSVNIGLQPDWGPRGYNHVDYYYLPDVDSYYDVPTRQYVYLEGGSWVHRRYLPSRYRGYDLYGGRKIVINSRDPWMRHNEYRTRYVTNYRGGGYRGGYGGRTTVIHRNNYYGGPRGGYNHGGPRGGFDHGGPRGGFNNHGGGHDNHGGGGNHGGPGNGGNHGGPGNGGNHGGGGGNHGGGGRGGHRG
ncbi:hypothetical protein [Pedobacter westerhofensis]|nr:hypothetical protein [Pedobacter westerhofensis]